MVWVPAYWHTWGWTNFLLLCDLAVFISVWAFWRGSALLLSSQAVSMLLVGILWAADAASFSLARWHIIGGTNYLWDARFPLLVRLLSIYHVALPATLVWALRRTGYDPRGWKLQSALAAVITVLSRFGDPAKNLNFAFREPLFGQQWGPAPVHLAIVLIVVIFGIYWPTHRLLARWIPPARSKPSGRPLEAGQGLAP